jgi:hypothetical protein
MKIDRRSLLSATACLAMAKLVGPTFGHPRPSGSDEPSWHPLTQSLLHRARRASSIDGPTNMVQVERVIRETAGAQGCASPPVIKWKADPSDAFDHLSRYGLYALLQMGSASLWRRAGASIPFEEESLDSSLVLGGLVADIVGAEDHDRALMAPKLLAKSRAMAGNASAEAVFEVRAISAQIGWLETSMPVAAAEAVANIERLLSTGFSEHDEPVHHQLRVVEAYELGLLVGDAHCRHLRAPIEGRLKERLGQG